jgi:predicted alpha/beta hydrolase
MPHDRPVVDVETSDGHRFELIEVAPPKATRMILLLPGMGISARHYISFAECLAERGTRVFIHEWRGNGSSSRRAGKGRDWGYRELIELDLQAARLAVAERAESPVWLGGHSLGAQLACLAAAHRPEPAAGLVLIAGGAPYARVFNWRMRLTLAIVYRAFPMLSGLIGHFPGKRMGFAGTEARGVMTDWARTGRTGRYDLDTLDFEAETTLRRLELPVLTVRMEADGWVPPASLEWLLDKLPGCRIDRRVITTKAQGKRADHFGWLEAPAASAGTVATWLEES